MGRIRLAKTTWGADAHPGAPDVRTGGTRKLLHTRVLRVAFPGGRWPQRTRRLGWERPGPGEVPPFYFHGMEAQSGHAADVVRSDRVPPKLARSRFYTPRATFKDDHPTPSTSIPPSARKARQKGAKMSRISLQEKRLRFFERGNTHCPICLTPVH